MTDTLIEEDGNEVGLYAFSSLTQAQMTSMYQTRGVLLSFGLHLGLKEHPRAQQQSYKEGIGLILDSTTNFKLTVVEIGFSDPPYGWGVY